WHSFGTRRDAFDLTARGIAAFAAAHEHLDAAADVFSASLADPIERIFQSLPFYQEFAEIRVFTEFFGPNSFAGLHKREDPKELRLFDVWAAPYGFVGAARFVADFAAAPAARKVYEGKLTGQFSEDVRAGRYNVQEGVVCKGGSGGADVWMVKIKTQAYQARLRQAFAERWEDYWE
ncbi:MAG TPA: RNA ligase family protein, partial [Herpetosiphonaceae bacterium]|nr:RNA ligase family protein [Herpetosiphonaceae bacterium]